MRHYESGWWWCFPVQTEDKQMELKITTSAAACLYTALKTQNPVSMDGVFVFKQFLRCYFMSISFFVCV
jgi:hypothetical protein